MDRGEFVTAIVGTYFGKDQGKKSTYRKAILDFAGKCEEENLYEVYTYAMTLRYKNADMLHDYAKEKGYLIEASTTLKRWTCDHGGVGTPREVIGSRCSSCGDRVNENERRVN